MASCCVCLVNVSKKDDPELIFEPYRGKCPSFYDKKVEEAYFEKNGISEFIKGMWE